MPFKETEVKVPDLRDSSNERAFCTKGRVWLSPLELAGGTNWGGTSAMGEEVSLSKVA